MEPGATILESIDLDQGLANQAHSLDPAGLLSDFVWLLNKKWFLVEWGHTSNLVES